MNAVSAGWVEGSEGEHSYRDEVSDRVRPHVPAGRNVRPEDVAAAVAWLCSEEAPMLVGQTIHLDVASPPQLGTRCCSRRRGQAGRYSGSRRNSHIGGPRHPSLSTSFTSKPRRR